MKKSVLAFSAIFLLCFVESSYADIVYQLGPGSNTTSVIDSTWKFGQSFTNSSSTGSIQDIKVYLSKQGSLTGTLTTRIYNATGSPGNYIPDTTSLISSASIDVTSVTTQGYYSFNNFSGHTLTGGNRYVFVLDFASVTGLNGSNYVNFFQGTGTGIGVSGQNAITNVAGTWNPDNTYNYSAIISVPEPGTFILGSIAVASGGFGAWWKRRRRRCVHTSE
jgi:hypothetical protein